MQAPRAWLLAALLCPTTYSAETKTPTFSWAQTSDAVEVVLRSPRSSRAAVTFSVTRATPQLTVLVEDLDAETIDVSFTRAKVAVS